MLENYTIYEKIAAFHFRCALCAALSFEVCGLTVHRSPIAPQHIPTDLRWVEQTRGRGALI
jgi:hypothetical protein